MTSKNFIQAMTIGILMAATIAFAVAVILPISSSDNGFWVSRFAVTSSAPNDTGIAFFYYFAQNDSRSYGIDFTGGTGALDTGVASFGSTTPNYLTGSVASTGISQRYVQVSDTARISLVTLSYADSVTGTAGATTWSNPLRSTTGTATDSFLYQAANFGQAALAWSADDANLATLQSTDSIVIARGASATQALRFRVSSDKVTDSARIVLIRPNGRIHDTVTIRTSGGAAGGETFSVPNAWIFDSGTTAIFIVHWNSDSGKIQVKEGEVYCDEQKTTITGGSGTAVGTGLSANINSVSLAVNSIGLATPVASVLLAGGGNAPGSQNAADLYITVDSNASDIGFETRFPNSVFDVTVVDSAGGIVSKLPSGQKHLLTLNYAFNGIPLGQVQRGKILHYKLATNSWEALTTTVTVDTNGNSGNAVATAEVTEYSPFAFGTLSPGTLESNDDANCVLGRAATATGLERTLPVLRDLRDAALRTAPGRALISAYYGASAWLFLFALPIAFARRRRSPVR